MNSGAIAGASSAYAMQAYHQSTRPAQEAGENTRGPDHDSDQDDQAVSATPTVNGMGQLIGQLLNTVA